MTTDVSGPIRKNKRPSGEIRSADVQERHAEVRQRYQVLVKVDATSVNLTSVCVGGARFIFVDQSLDLVLPQSWEQLLVEPRVPLLLVEELGEILLCHGGFVGAGGHSEA